MRAHCLVPSTVLPLSSAADDVESYAAQDQLRALREMCFAAFGDKCPHVDVYDGDTAQACRLQY